MKTTNMIMITVLVLISCSSEPLKPTNPLLLDKGIGPITTIRVIDDIDQRMASEGLEKFNQYCSSCHKMDKKFIGPALDGVTLRRSPEWVMNMILNPEVMVKENPIARELLMEYIAPMANQNLTPQEARAILEYFRQYDKTIEQKMKIEE